MLLKVLAGFKQRVSDAKEKRRKEDLATQMVARMLHALGFKAWESWRSFIEATRRKQSAELMMKRLQNAMLYKCFMGLAYMSNLARRERSKSLKGDVGIDAAERAVRSAGKEEAKRTLFKRANTTMVS